MIIFFLLAAGAILAGVAAAVGAALLYFRKRQALERMTATAPGEVVGLTYSSGEHTRLTHPVVRFQTRDGETVEFTSPTGYSPAQHRVGQRVEVRYDPEHPEEAVVGSSFMAHLPALVAAILAVFGLLFGGCFCCIGLLGMASLSAPSTSTFSTIPRTAPIGPEKPKLPAP